MAKKTKKTTKKPLKAKVSKKRTSNQKVVRKRTTKVKSMRRRKVVPHNFYLHTAKQAIMNAVPIMPCSVIKKDRGGRLYAHTQAENVYNVYREKCELHGLVIRKIEGMAYETTRPSFRINKDDVCETIKVPCVRYEGKWEVCHVASGETETFCGAGDGDNEIWSVNSAQTVAKKCGLLDYFEVAWPQPTDWLQTVRESMEELPPAELFKAIQGVIPKAIFEATKIGDLLTDYFNSVLKNSKKGK